MAEEKIKFVADASDYLKQMNMVSSDSKKLFETLRVDSENQHKDQKKINEELKTRIELLREQNRLQREQSQEISKQQFLEGKIDKYEHQRNVHNIGYQGKFEEHQYQSLNKQYKTYSNNYTANAATGSDGGDGAMNIMGSVGKGGLKALGWLGVAMSAIGIANEFKDGFLQMEESLKGYSTLSGKGIGSEAMLNSVKGLDAQDIYQIGIKPSEYFQNLYKQRVSRGGISKDDGLNLMAMDRATLLDQGSIGSLLETQRYSPEMSISGVVGSLRDSLGSNSRSVEEMNVRLKETTESITSVSDDIIRTSGGMSASQISGLLTTTMGIQRLTGLQGKPLETVHGALSGGLKMSSNPVMQSIQMDAMRRAMPNSSLWEIEKAMETPMDNPEYVWNVLQSINSIAGTSGDEKERMLYNAFGGSGLSKSLSGSLLTGGTSKEKFMKTFNSKGGRDFVGLASSQTGGAERLAAFKEGGYESTGFEKAEGVMQKMANGTKNAENDLETITLKDTFNSALQSMNFQLQTTVLQLRIINRDLSSAIGIANPGYVWDKIFPLGYGEKDTLNTNK